MLLACRFFDESLTGYLEEKDVEDILHLTHRHTTRRWVQSLVEAPCGRARRLRYIDHESLLVPYYPTLPAPVGIEEGGAVMPSSGGSTAPSDFALLDGVTVNIRSLQALSQTMQADLQAEKVRCMLSYCPNLPTHSIFHHVVP